MTRRIKSSHPRTRALWGVRAPGALLLALVVAIPTIQGCTSEAEYPWRPITLVCPWGVGGGTDRVSRQMAFFLEHELGVPVNVVNATGGNGVTGHARGLFARPDGYTLTMMTSELNMLRHRGMTTVSYEDALPLFAINQDAAALFVPVDSPYTSATQLIEAIKENPGTLTASGTAAGGVWHMALVGLIDAAGAPTDAVTWVPDVGAEPSLAKLEAGGVDFVACSLPEARTRLVSGAIRCLGVMANDPVPGFEDIPTLKQQGYDWAMLGWRGLGLPAGTPPERAAVLNEAIYRIVTGQTVITQTVTDPETGAETQQQLTFPAYMDREGFDRQWMRGDEFARFLAETDAKFAQLFASPEYRTTAATPIGLMTFPFTIGVLIIVCLAALAVRRVLRPAPVTPSAPPDDAAAAARPPYTQQTLINAGLILAAVIAYTLLAELLGFVIVAGAILLVLLLRLRARPVTAIAVTVILVPIVYYAFATLLRVPLPPPPWMQ